MMGFTLPLYLTVFPGELISLCYLFHSTITLIELHQDDVCNICKQCENYRTVLHSVSCNLHCGAWEDQRCYISLATIQYATVVGSYMYHGNI